MPQELSSVAQGIERIARNLRAPGCRWYPVAGADHDSLWKFGAAAYERTVLDFLSDNCR